MLDSASFTASGGPRGLRKCLSLQASGGRRGGGGGGGGGGGKDSKLGLITRPEC